MADTPPRVALLDTNVILADLDMAGPSFRMLFEGARRGGVTIAVPAVVLDEVQSHVYRGIEDAVRKVGEGAKDIQRLTARSVGPGLSTLSIEAEALAHRARLEAMIGAAGGRILSYPRVSHNSLARKAMLRKRPFDANGRGYRDALIWENVKAQARKRTVAFISNNSKDFCDNGMLHGDLLQELDEQGTATGRVMWYPTLRDFLDAIVAPTLRSLDDLKKQLNDRTIGDIDLGAALQRYVELWEIDWSANPRLLELPPTVSDARIHGSGPIRNVQVLEVRQLHGREVVVWVCFDIELSVWFFADKHDDYVWKSPNYSIDVYDWNKTMMTVETHRTLDVSAQMSIDTSNWKIKGAELSGYRVVRDSRSRTSEGGREILSDSRSE